MPKSLALSLARSRFLARRKFLCTRSSKNEVKITCRWTMGSELGFKSWDAGYSLQTHGARVNVDGLREGPK